jgi:hypothetical protein
MAALAPEHREAAGLDRKIAFALGNQLSTAGSSVLFSAVTELVS